MFSVFKEAIESVGGLPGEFLTEEIVRRLYIHTTELLEAGKVMNLTAITDVGDAARLHAADSLFAAGAIAKLSQGKDTSLIDVGSGGGFPALPIAIALPNVSVTALDATAKKCEFIALVAAKCDVKVGTLPERAEEAAAKYRESFDFASARAVARLNALLELCVPFVKVGGYFVAMKGSAAKEEAEEAKRAAKTLGVTLSDTVDYEIEGGGARRILIYKKVAPTPSAYPRRYAQIKKKPL